MAEIISQAAPGIDRTIARPAVHDRAAAGRRWTGLSLRALVIAALFWAGDIAIFEVLKSGMDHYYGFDEPARVLCVGYSHTVLGIDAARMEDALGVPVAKYATAGANTLDRLWMVRQFVERRPTVRTVVYDVDPRLFDTEGLSSASYSLFLPYIDDPAMNRYLLQEATWQEFYTARAVRTLRFRDQTINIALRGLLGRVENKKGTRMHLAAVRERLERERQRRIRINPEALACFRETVAFLTGKGIDVVLVFLPVADLLNATDPEGLERVTGLFRDLAQANPRVRYLDYNRDYQHRHELFYDLRHLNAAGNALVTGRLIEDLGRSEVGDQRAETAKD